MSEPEIAYHHTWYWEGKSNEFVRSGVGLPTADESEIYEQCRQITYDKIVGNLVSEALKQGITITLKSCDVQVDLQHRRETRWRKGVPVYYHYYVAIIKATTKFDTDKPLGSSPLEPATLAFILILIKYVIAGIVAYFLGRHLIDALTTTTSTIKTITTKHYPDCTTETTETTETTTGPSPLAIGGSVVVIIAVVGLLLLFLVGLPRRR